MDEWMDNPRLRIFLLFNKKKLHTKFPENYARLPEDGGSRSKSAPAIHNHDGQTDRQTYRKTDRQTQGDSKDRAYA